MRYSLALLFWAAITTANPVALPQAVTQKIAPSEPAPPGCSTAFVGSFGIAVAPLATAAPSPKKRAVASTESCGPLTVAHVSQIGDGQIQAAIEYVTFLSVNQTGDCQFAPASELGSNGEHVAPVTQIGDGQLQAPVASATPKSNLAVAPTPTVTPVAPAPTSAAPPSPPSPPPPPPPAPQTFSSSSTTPPPPPPPPAPQTSSSSSTPPPPPPPPAPETFSSSSTPPPPPPSSAALPAPASTPEVPSPFAPAGGPSSAAGSAAPATASPSSSVSHPYVICDSPGSLAITLEDGVLKDQAGRTGYIAANYQFQFDGPPQAGAIITAGFSVCNNGSLALGGTSVFYQCLSGSFYNLYDRSWAAQCSPVVINTLFITKC